jgi:hypothetical protein
VIGNDQFEYQLSFIAEIPKSLRKRSPNRLRHPIRLKKLTMFTKTKTALAAALVAATSTVAFAAAFDPNPANRHPAYAEPIGVGEVQFGTFRSAPVALHSGRVAAMIDAGFYGYSRQLDPSGADLNDRGSSPYAAGVN